MLKLESSPVALKRQAKQGGCKKKSTPGNLHHETPQLGRLPLSLHTGMRADPTAGLSRL